MACAIDICLFTIIILYMIRNSNNLYIYIYSQRIILKKIWQDMANIAKHAFNAA